MRYLISVLGVLLAFNLALAQDSTLTKNKIIEDGQSFYLYKVQESEGFMAIGRKYGVAYQDIIEANKATALTGLKVGEFIRIPIIEGRNTNTNEIKSDQFVYHKVEAGETLFFISRKYGVSILDIVKNNPEADGVLSVGMELKIPKETQAAQLSSTALAQEAHLEHSSDYSYHTIQPKETSFGLAQKYHVALVDITKANPGIDPEHLKVGTKLRIPKQSIMNAEVIEKEELSDTKYTYHRIKNGESIRSIANLYDIPETVLRNANHFETQLPPVGYILKVPHAYEYQVEVEATEQQVHIIKKKEDIREIAEEYQTPIMDIKAANPQVKKWNRLKRGNKLYIPTLTVSSVDSLVKRSPEYEEDKALIHYFENQEASLGDTINVAFIWPLFLEKNDTINRVEQEDETSHEITITERKSKVIYPGTPHFREFYFSALMAINDLKNKGINIKLSTYDSNKSTIDILRLLEDSTLKDNDIIFGPGLANQIKPVADFCLLNRIRLVVPFQSECQSIKDNPFIYQIIPGAGVEYPYIAQQVASRYQAANIILVKGKGNDKREVQFTEIFKSELYNPDSLLYRDIHYKELSFNRDHMGGLTALLSKERENLVIIPAEKNKDYTMVIPVLENYQKIHQDVPITLLGFSEWQAFERRELENLFNVGCEIYTPFYCSTNDSTPAYMNYISRYETYFSTTPRKTYPYHGMLGYDVCNYFITGLAQYGNRLENHLQEFAIDGLCVDLHFERVNNWGGFVNTSFYQIEYAPDYNIYHTPKGLEQKQKEKHTND